MTRPVLLVVGLALAAAPWSCSDPGSPRSDAGMDADLPPPDPLDPDPGFDPGYQGYGPEATVTTAVQVLRPRYDPSERFVDRWGRLRVPPEEIGRDYPQPGEPHQARDEFGAGGTADATDRSSLLYVAALSDAQLVDIQSPAYVPGNKGTSVGLELPAFHLAAPRFPHLLDAQIHTALMFARDRDFDFFIHTGDAVENAQRNELTWFLAILNGGTVGPDSGLRDDPVPGPANDAFDPFVAPGVPPETPWFATLGNHDIMVNGNFPPGLIEEVHAPEHHERITEVLSGFDLTLPGIATGTWAPSVLPFNENPALVHTYDSFTPEAVPTLQQLMALQGGEIAADPARAPMDPCDFIDTHFGAGNPDGHGFTAQSLDFCNGWYVADPAPGIPIRLIVLDTGPHIGGVKGSITPPLNPDGTLDQTRVGDPMHDQWAFVIQELDRAATDAVAVILASHHSTKDTVLGNSLGTVGALLFPEDPDIQQLWERYLIEPEQSYGGAQLRALLTSYPNIILHLVGHTHRNRVMAICPDGSYLQTQEAGQGLSCPAPPQGRTAANGYWEVMTASTAKYPHQFRIIEVVDNRDGTGSIYVTSVNPQAGPDSLPHYARRLGLADEQMSGDDSLGGSGLLGDRNVELRIRWDVRVAAALAVTAGHAQIQTMTTLVTPQPGLPTLPLWP